MLRRLCAIRRVAQAMGARCRAARAVRRWSAAAAARRWACDAKAVARQAHLALQRARRAAAVARGWVRLRRWAEARLLAEQRTASAARVYARLMERWLGQGLGLGLRARARAKG